MAWLSFSAPAADASTQQGTDSLLSGISSTVSSVGNSEAKSAGGSPRVLKVIDSVTALPAAIPTAVTAPVPASAPVPPAGRAPARPSPPPAPAPEVLSPVVGGIVAPLEAAAATLPSAEVIPAGTLTRVTSSVVGSADTAVGRVAEGIATTVVEPVTETAPALEQPLEAISDGLATTPLSTAPALAPLAEIVNGLSPAPVTTAVLSAPSAPATDSLDSAAPSREVMVAAITGVMPAIQSGIAGASSRSGDRALLSTIFSGPGGALDGGAQSPDAPLPAPPSGLGSGSGQSAGGPSPSAALLSSPFEYLPPASGVPVTGPLQNAPSPVAFDPGSSPD